MRNSSRKGKIAVDKCHHYAQSEATFVLDQRLFVFGSEEYAFIRNFLLETNNIEIAKNVMSSNNAADVVHTLVCIGVG